MKWGILFRWRSLWIGAHWSPYNRRLCINLLPMITLWIVWPGGITPSQERLINSTPARPRIKNDVDPQLVNEYLRDNNATKGLDAKSFFSLPPSISDREILLVGSAVIQLWDMAAPYHVAAEELRKVVTQILEDSREQKDTP